MSVATLNSPVNSTRTIFSFIFDDFLSDIQAGDLQKVTEAIALNPNYIAEVSNQNGQATALQTATTSGHLEIVKLIVESGAELEQAPGTTSTPLQLAVSCDYPEIVKYLLDRGAIFEHNTEQDPIFVAIGYGYEKTLRHILQAYQERSIDLPEKLLFNTLAYEHPKCLGLLIEYGANIEEEKSSANRSITPLTAALLTYKTNRTKEHKSTVLTLINSGANAEVTKEYIRLHIRRDPDILIAELDRLIAEQQATVAFLMGFHPQEQEGCSIKRFSKKSHFEPNTVGEIVSFFKELQETFFMKLQVQP